MSKSKFFTCTGCQPHRITPNLEDQALPYGFAPLGRQSSPRLRRPSSPIEVENLEEKEKHPRASKPNTVGIEKIKIWP